MASIRTKQLANGERAYLVRYRAPDGRERTKQFRRRRDAQHYAHLVEIDRLQGGFVDPRLGKVTVDQWFQRWWPTVNNLRPSTRARDEASYRLHVLPAFGATPLGRVDRTNLREWVAELSDADGSGLAPATVIKAVQVFNKVMRAALEDRMIPANPVERLPLPKLEHKETRYLNIDELWTLAGAIDRRYRAFVLVGGYAGLRLGEILALRWANVDLLHRRLLVAETLSDLAGSITFGPPKTKAAVRRVGIPGFLADELSVLAEVPLDPSQLVFRSPEGHPVRPTSFRRRFWNPAVVAARMAPLRIHDLRHTAVALWIAAGANPKQVAVRAGHTSVSVVLDRYGHLFPEQEAALVDALERTIPRRDAN